MKLTTIDDFTKYFPWAARSLNNVQPTVAEQTLMLKNVSDLAPKYFNTVYNPKNVSLDDKFNAIVVYLEDYAPQLNGYIYQAQLFVHYVDKNKHVDTYGLFDINFGLTRTPHILVQNITDMADL